MDFLSSSFLFATTQILTKRDQQVLNTLPEDLKKSLTSSLAAGIGKTCQTTKKILLIAALTPSSTNRDRLFLHLSKDNEENTQACLEKIQQIAEEGFFSDFLLKMECQKKKYHSLASIFEKVDNFYNNEFLSKKKNRNEKILAQDENGYAPDSAIQAVHDKVLKCRYFYQHSTPVKEYLKYAEDDGIHLSFLYRYLIEQLEVEYESKFSEFERLKILQILFLVGSPNNLKTIFCYSEVDVEELLRQASSLKNKAGEETLELFLNSVLSNKQCNLDEALRGLNLIVNISNKDTFIETIDRWQVGGCEWRLLFEILEAEADHVNFDLLNDINQLDSCISRFRNDPTVTMPLCDDDLELIKNQYIIVNQFCEMFCNYSFNQLVAEAVRIREKAKGNNITLDDRLSLIAISRLTIKIHFGIYPYYTQVLALLGTLARNNSRQAQVKTGEGKSTIVAMWTFVNAMECKSVDIITSARYLAIRDQSKFEEYFKRCSITTSHICHDNKKSKHFEAQVLYGPSFDFEFALMDDMLHRTQLFKARLTNPFVKNNFDCVCVDESDNLLIDGAQNGARVAISAEESYDWVYAPLLNYIKQLSDPHSKVPQEEKDLFNSFRVSTQKFDINDLLSKIDPNIPFEKILVALFLDNNIKEIHRLFIANTKKFVIEHVGLQHQMACHNLDDKMIYRWINSAINGLLNKHEKVDYIVKLERDSDGKVIRKVQIVDLKTGRISEKSRWSDGLHEFLEVKHDISVAKESLVPLSYFHTVFFNKYKMITALTGTAERLQTKEIYNIETFDVPPHKPMIRIDEPARFTIGKKMHLNTVLEIIKKTVKARRPILVLCENIKDSDELSNEVIKQGFQCQLLNEVQEELEHEVISKAGIPGKITIATNTAGRGTDIILPEESLNNGGLHVLLTFFPGTEREELQAIGRAGRQGQPGSSVMVIDIESQNITKFSPEDHHLEETTLLDSLLQLRSQYEVAMSRAQFSKAHLESFLAKISEEIYDKLLIWSGTVESEMFLAGHGQKLNNLKLRQKRNFDFQHLSVKDEALATECVQLLKRRTEILEWKLLLSKTVERLREKIIQKWALKFYQPVTSLIKEKQDINRLKTEIQNLFNQFKNDWDRFLNRDGTGVLAYLEELTGVKLQK